MAVLWNHPQCCAGHPQPPYPGGQQRILRAKFRPRPPVAGNWTLLWYRGLSGSTRSWMDAFTGPYGEKEVGLRAGSCTMSILHVVQPFGKASENGTTTQTLPERTVLSCV